MNTNSGSVSPNAESGPVVRIRLDISYDGTAFAGWAVQPAQRTVAGVLGEALATLFRVPVSLVVAGRTDAGVHAIGQVAHIDVDPARLATLTPRRRSGDTSGHTPLTGLSRRLAGMLPTDVRVRSATAAPDGFDARFSALRRHYRYRISTAAWGVEPIVRAGVLAHQRPLDIEAMSRAAATLLGLQDFATFCKARPGATTIRELQQLAVSAIDDDVLVQVTADAFCHSMVRSLVGALIDVGEGRLPVTEPAVMLFARRRTSAVHTAPACGLTLVGVDYPPATEMAERAAATRTLRRGDVGSSTDNDSTGNGDMDEGEEQS